MRFQRRQLLRIMAFGFGSNFLFSCNQLGMAEQTPTAGGTDGHGHSEGTEMERVTGIGGLFFRAHDPKTLASWYQQHLGIMITPSGSGEHSWQQEAGPTVFAPFPETTKYFGDPQKAWMVNFRVRDLDKMAAQLQAAGIEIKIDPKSYPYGRFARLHDPEGNPIELWQPAGPNAPR